MIEIAEDLGQHVGVKRACEELGVPRSSLYRTRHPQQPSSPRPKPVRALDEGERQVVREVLNSNRFVDSAPRQVYATLLDEGQYLCSWRTMYRVLAEHGEIRERRNQLTHPAYAKPELLATAPNQLWSWDITKLLGPAKWTYFYLYVILDVFSRYVVGWLVAEREAASLAETLIAETCAKQNIHRDQLTLHADRGSSMRSKPVALLLADLGVTKTHTRPYTSNDNPYSEAQFKTLKYRPDYPARFGSLMDARGWSQDFFAWYNNDHYHTGLSMMTPAMVHYGLADAVRDQRNQVLQAAFTAHPERFVRGMPTVSELPREVWINRPSGTPLTDIAP